VLDAFQGARLAAVEADSRVRTAIDEIVAARGDVGVAAVWQQAYASPRQLGRLFDDWVGMSPKRFARVVRAQAVIRRLADDPAADLATLAAELGYSDHAHLTRELRALTGAPPRELAARLQAAESFKR
jgi:AraC-like DNA-binding protein